MALNSQNREALSFKKLFGKAHTQFGFAIGNEGISSNIQIASSTVFGETINPLPVTDAGLTTLLSTDSVVERVKFEIEIIPDTLIGANQSQGYALKLPTGYNGLLKNDYSGGTLLYNGLGRLQIVPKLYGELDPADFSTEYDPILYETDGSTVIPTLSPINWNLDPYNGVIFVQNPPANYDVSANRPGFLEAFLYVGDYLNSLSGGTGSNVSGERIEKEITQISHGFKIGDVLTSSGGTYIKAIALETTPEALGIVTVTGGTDIFTLTYAGYTEQVDEMTDEFGLALSADTTYYLSEQNVGKLTPEKPISAGEVEKPMMYVYNNGTSANIFQVRGDIITTASTTTEGTVTVVNSGTGAEVGVVPNAGDTVELRTLVGSGDTFVTQVGDEIIISSVDSQNIRKVFRTTANTYTVSNLRTNAMFVASGTTSYDLPSNPIEGAQLTFADGLGTAESNVITLNGNGNNIVESSNALIDTNYGSISVEYNGVFWSVTGAVQ